MNPYRVLPATAALTALALVLAAQSNDAGALDAAGGSSAGAETSATAAVATPPAASPQAAASPAAAPTAPSSAPAADSAVRTEKLALQPFSKLKLAGAGIEIEVQIGSGPAEAQLTGDAKALDGLETRVRDGVLEVHRKGPRPSESKLKLVVQTPSLDDVEVAGSGTVVLNDLLCERFSANIAGSGDLRARGTAKAVALKIAGSGTVDVQNLVAETAEVNIAGSGTVTLHASRSLDARVTGSGNIRYSGNPAEVKRNVAGSGKVAPAE